MKNQEKGIIHFIPILIVVIVLIGGWFAYQKYKSGIILPGIKISLSCDPLTLVSLKDLYGISGVKSTSGEKCAISKEAYLLRLTYENYQQAEKAKIGLIAETAGDKKQIEGADLITSEGNSSAFYVEGQELKVLVMTGITDEAVIKGMVLGLKNTESTKNVPDVSGKATDSQIKSDISQIKAGLEQYFAEKEVYPKTLDELVTANIIKTIPTNPKTNNPYDFFCNGESYTMSTTLSDGSSFQVSSEE